MRLATLVLAAGASRRLGQPKQLLPFRGTTLLRHVVNLFNLSHAPSPGRSFFAGKGETVIVLGAHAEIIAPTLTGLPVRIIVADDWQEGMAASLRAGIHAVEEHGADAVLILLCDQPNVTTEHLNTLIESFEPGEIVASDYGDALGPPCVFDKKYFPELRALTGDTGARKLLQKYPCRRVEFSGGRVDVDTPTDWAQVTSEPPG